MRAVKAGEELTCDYGFDPNNQVIIIIIKFIVNIYRFFLVFTACAALVSSLVGEGTGSFLISIRTLFEWQTYQGRKLVCQCL